MLHLGWSYGFKTINNKKSSFFLALICFLVIEGVGRDGMHNPSLGRKLANKHNGVLSPLRKRNYLLI